MKKSTITLLALGALFSASQASAALVYSTSFETTDGFSVGSDMGTETQPEISFTFNQARSVISSTSITYTDAGSGTTIGGGQSLGVATSGNFGGRTNSGSTIPWSGAAYDNSDFFVSFLAQTTRVGSHQATVALDLSGNRFGAGLRVGPNLAISDQEFVGFDSSASQFSLGVGTITSGETYFVVFQVENASAGNWDTVNVWINPAFGSSAPSPTGSATGTPNGNANNGLVFDGDAGASFFDEVKVGTSWNDVVPVPEPSTYALYAGFLALGLVMWRRRARG